MVNIISKYRRGQILKYNKNPIFVDEILIHTDFFDQETLWMYAYVIERNGEVNLDRIKINISETIEFEELGGLPDEEYVEYITEKWNMEVDATYGYEIATSKEAKFIAFTKSAIENSSIENLSANMIYPMKRDESSGVFFVIDDNNELLISVETDFLGSFFKESENAWDIITENMEGIDTNINPTSQNSNVVSIFDYAIKKNKNIPKR